MPSCDVLVVGAGCHGLCAAWAAQARGLRVQVVERFGAGHDLGSSHGTSRITRTAYADPEFASLAQRAMREDWPALATNLGLRALYPTPGLFFGPDSPRLRGYLAATQQVCSEVQVIAVSEARRRFPRFTFGDADAVLVDPTAALIAAGDVLARLRDCLRTRGASLHFGVEVRELHSSNAAVLVETSAGPIEAAAVVLATGAWLPTLAPWLCLPITPLRQHVAYYRLDAEPAACVPGRFPVWCWIGADPNDFFYGLPEFGRTGVKVARHVTAGDADPDANDAQRLAEQHVALLDVDDFVRRNFVGGAARVGQETCLYGVAPHEQFKICAQPGEPRVVAVAACSGHGFKFAPLVGRVAVELLLERTPPPAILRGRAS